MLSVSRLYTVGDRTINMEHLAEWELAGEIQVLGENLRQQNFSHW
jgi:hypothetical protein